MFNLPTYLLEQQVLTSTASSVTFTYSAPDVSWTPRHLLVRVNARSARAASIGSIEINFNDDNTETNYHRQRLTGVSTTVAAARGDDDQWMGCPAANAGSNAFGGGECLVPDAFSTRSHKSFVAFSGEAEEGIRLAAGRWANTAAITKVEVLEATGANFEVGSTFDFCVIDESFQFSEQII